MTIRFQCGSCSQPIEIDDEWASKPVACPYCRNTVAAPAESTLADPGEMKMASPVDSGVLADRSTPASPEFPMPPSGKNTIALVAVILASCSTLLLLLGLRILGAHGPEYEQLQDSMERASTLTETMTAQAEYLKAHPEMESWLVPATMLVFFGGLGGIAAVVCGLIGVRRPTRRRLAVAALVIAMLPLFFCCSGMALG